MKIKVLLRSQMIPFFVSIFLFIIVGDISYLLPFLLTYIISSLIIYTLYENILIEEEKEMERIRQKYVDKEIEVSVEKET